jgi:hypothetical protein
MGAVPPLKSIRVEDLPSEIRSAFSGTFSILNLFMRATAQALNRQLTVTENLLGFTYTAQARYSTDFPLKFTNKISPVKPSHLLVTRAVKVDASTGEELTPVACTVAWRILDTGEVEVSSPTGLTAGLTYRITLLILA